MTRQLVVNADYNGIAVSFTGDGWFNATDVAERFGKRIDHWLSNQETKDYILALIDNSNTRLYGDLSKAELAQFIKTKRGNNGGTWFHPDLAVPFARWLDMRFSIWCDRQIRQLLTGNHPHHDWQRMRHEAASSFKVMTAIIKMNLEANGKTPCPYHFSNEARLVNWALTGEFCKIDREALAKHELDLLAQLENFNSVLAGSNHGYDYRKQALQAFALTLRNPVMLGGIAA